MTAYTREQTDGLREVVNVAMGMAASSLARILGTFVRLPVPRVRLVDAWDVLTTLRELTRGSGSLLAVRQAFTSTLRGEALVVFGDDGVQDLGPFLGYQAPLSSTDVEEILLEISNILVGACLGAIAKQLGHDLLFAPPTFIGRDSNIEELIAPARMTWERSLVVEVNFRLEDKDFVCHILLFWPEESIDAVGAAVDRLLEDT